MRHTIKSERQVVRFATVGAANTVLDFGLLFVLRVVGVPPVIANICSTGVAFLFSFVVNKKYTFKSTNPRVIRELILFTVITLFGLWVIQSFLIWWLTPIVDAALQKHSLALLISKLIASLVSLTWNYLCYNFIVFRKKPELVNQTEE